jgi:C4-dicarboxylate-specific signal transduction histidine kinase
MSQIGDHVSLRAYDSPEETRLFEKGKFDITGYAIDDDPRQQSAMGSLDREDKVIRIGLTEVSDCVRGQRKLAQLQEEIAHAARILTLGELAASIAHEISQPLTAIGSNIEATQLWLEGSPPNLEEVRQLTARTAAEVQRAADIIHRIHAMAVRSTPKRVPTAINPVIKEAILFLRHELQQNSVRVSLHLEDHLPEILGDPVQLQQVIVNLGVNAIQAMNNTEIATRQLLISSSLIADQCVRITVEDTGPGIASELRDRVFESFFTTKSAGMGIGLPICQTIIEAHRGRIDLAHHLDSRGAQFKVVLPSCLSTFSMD